MIARYQVLLPAAIDRPVGAEPQVFEASVEGYSVRIWPPTQTVTQEEDLNGRSVVPLFSAMLGLRPNPEPRVSTGVVIDSEPTVLSNLLVIDFVKPEFDRTPDSDDPPFALGLAIANDVVGRIRYLLRSPHLRPIPDNSPSRIEYLNDDGTQLEPAPPLIRARVLGSFSMTWNAVDNAGWLQAMNLPPDFSPPAWDSLLLDAFSLLPHVEGSIALAFSALEAFIDWALDEFAARGALDAELYRWIADRDELAKRPSTSEQFDILLKHLGGRSLKEDVRLWQLFAELRKARNSIVHEGRAAIGQVPVSAQKAAELVTAVREIIDWVEASLPPEKQRQRLQSTVTVTSTKALSGPGDAVAFGAAPVEHEDPPAS